MTEAEPKASSSVLRCRKRCGWRKRESAYTNLSTLKQWKVLVAALQFPLENLTASGNANGFYQHQQRLHCRSKQHLDAQECIHDQRSLCNCAEYSSRQQCRQRRF